MLGYWDPIGLADISLWGQDTEASIGAAAHDPSHAARHRASPRARRHWRTADSLAAAADGSARRPHAVANVVASASGTRAGEAAQPGTVS